VTTGYESLLYSNRVDSMIIHTTHRITGKTVVKPQLSGGNHSSTVVLPHLFSFFTDGAGSISFSSQSAVRSFLLATISLFSQAVVQVVSHISTLSIEQYRPRIYQFSEDASLDASPNTLLKPRILPHKARTAV